MGLSTDKTVTQRFLEIETEHDVFNVRPDNIPIWERIRFNLHREIKRQVTDSGQAHTKLELTPTSYLRGITLWAKNAISKNPYLSGNHNLLFFGHSRRKLNTNGVWEDIYCDPIYLGSDLDYLHIEEPYLMDHKTPATTDNLRYVDFIHYTGAIRRNLGLSDVSITGPARQRLNEVNEALEATFDVEVDVLGRAETKLTRRDSILDLYKLFLRRVRPEVAVVVVSYGKHTFLEACHELEIPTVELQHGVVHESHLAYSFPGVTTKETFPDYFLSWGEYWNDAAVYPIPAERIIAVGYPYLEQRRKNYQNVESGDQILFISQGTIGEQLSKFAIEVNEHPDIDHDIVYKLHPGEYDRWREEYPWLVDADFEVIDSSEPPLYRLFAESNVQIGVGSTAIFEGLCFDLETYVYNCSGASVLGSLVDEGAAELVSSADELASTLGTGKVAFDREYYFEPNATENARQVLDRLAKEGSPRGPGTY